MFHFSRKIICSIEAVLYVALAGSTAPVRARAITRRQNIPERYLEQPLQRLVRCGILRGVRGPRGGYLLAREPERIRLDEIVTAVRGLGSDAESEHATALSALGRDVVLPVFAELDAMAMERLSRISIADLMRPAQPEARLREHAGTVKMMSA